ncbi:telomeric repeat-binding factor 2-interacting protein 1 [Phaenicophaeus curvirostris]|uniref:telomeric repeat-binding factor 2-interacting protein 1 n=1 Tax=Phaenicophaeus curvirostris TaxID=33595 RepID=UPI0037F0E09C
MSVFPSGRACAPGAAMAGRRGSPGRSLFVRDDGSPMRFYVRPGPAKLRLAPLVLAGGGRLCRVQEPGAVPLAQPGEAAPAGAVSADFVTECVRRNRRLPIEPFRLPAPAPAPSSTSSSSSSSSSSSPASPPRGRLAFSAAEDAALLRAVRGRAGAGGRALWRELERRALTRHSWQAMRERYRRHLRPRESHQAQQPLRSPGLFEAANQEFESTESGSDASDVSEDLSAQTGEQKSPGETASGLRTGPEDSALPDTQLQREERPTRMCCSSSEVGEVVKTMQHFMEKFGMDLLTVTQAFLKNSGEVEPTLQFLETGRRLDGYPVWSREDDLELQKDDEHVRNKLIAKFGAENVAKRVAFRKN